MCSVLRLAVRYDIYIYMLIDTIGLKGRRFYDMGVIQASSQGMLAEFRTVHFMRCFECWHDCWPSVCSAKETTLNGITLITR